LNARLTERAGIKNVFYQRGVITTTTMRVKKFLFDFILLPPKWIKTARQWVLKIFTSRTCYKPLLNKDLF
jgi:hypothetical protein